MASAPTSQPVSQPAAEVRVFAASHYGESGAARFGIEVAGLAALLNEVLSQRDVTESDVRTVLESLRLEELVLSRACIAGHSGAWAIFLTRYRSGMYEAAYKIAHDEAAGRALADSLYAELYGLDERNETRASKLRYYLGRGSLAGWLRMVMAQEYVNQYRRTRRETSLEAAIEDGKQFPAQASEVMALQPQVNAATAAELAALAAEERLLLASYYLDGRTLAEIAAVMHVHESTISRRLERATATLRKRIRKRLMQSGMKPRQADEAIDDVDVRDLDVQVRETLRQDRGGLPFYKEEG